MLSRRNILAATSGAAAIATASTEAMAATVDVKIDPFNQTDEQKDFHAARFPKLDQESLLSFAEGFWRWNATDIAGRDARRSYNEYLRSRDLPVGETDLGYEECFKIMLEHPPYAAKTRLQRSTQTLMWDRAMRAFHGEADKYLTLMEETDNAGPGSLELNPGIEPDYACHEIHAQPGGYVGDPFAGWVYHLALTTAFYQGRNEYDQVHLSIAQSCPKPADGEVRRILDMGCGSGLSTTAYKERFPDAEVWGIDAGAPMVRYAHHRAVKKNLDVHFAHRMAEDSKFPDGYFDIVSDYLVFHEMSAEAASKVMPEIFRILRPGGVFNHNDLMSSGNPNGSIARTIREKAASWNTHRHNVESFYHEYKHTDYPQLIRNAGFDVDLTLKSGRPFPPIVGFKSV
jgi:ubiquinone/menaquinone biosynthesis C-methylase UbiE